MKKAYCKLYTVTYAQGAYKMPSKFVGGRINLGVLPVYAVHYFSNGRLFVCPLVFSSDYTDTISLALPDVDDEQDENEDQDLDDEPEVYSGNRNRKLWKATCIRAAQSVGYYSLLKPSNLVSLAFPL